MVPSSNHTCIEHAAYAPYVFPDIPLRSRCDELESGQCAAHHFGKSLNRSSLMETYHQ